MIQKCIDNVSSFHCENTQSNAWCAIVWLFTQRGGDVGFLFCFLLFNRGINAKWRIPYYANFTLPSSKFDLLFYFFFSPSLSLCLFFWSNKKLNFWLSRFSSKLDDPTQLQLNANIFHFKWRSLILYTATFLPKMDLSMLFWQNFIAFDNTYFFFVSKKKVRLNLNLLKEGTEETLN